ncbi:unnamed protein product [Adineta steineri]|uniref:Uncharacterized protein n=1 Tax=Adineta steineri TaxID=433720 RepID=A0A814J5M9_9BILA|nr:unnamed protein product [Adineta steineri]CAF1068754.1 unnamed protein product [Adineta steineri]
MSKAKREVVLDVNDLSEMGTSLEEENDAPPKQLPKPLAELKEYVDSKFCYYSQPVGESEIISVEPKIAYQCSMKILVESRKLRMKTQPYPWKTERVLGSRALGRLTEDTEITGEAIGNLWTDYSVPVPSTDKSKQVFALSESTSYSRCSNCRAKCIVSCSSCSGSGGNSSYGDNDLKCTGCKGSGKMRCPKCRGNGGFRHVPTLTVKWFTCQTLWFYQNSFLHEKKIRKGERTCIWSVNHIPWSKSSSIEACIQTIHDDTPDIPLKANIIRDYYEKQFNPMQYKDNEMRRLDFSVERMNFEEVCYTMGESHVNKREPTLDNTFRFCRYPVFGEQTAIYENDYPYNCCGCFGGKTAWYAPCCTIL